MMVPSTAPRLIPTGLAGLAAVIDPTTKAFSFPGWCDWMPFADFFESCKPPTAAQLAASAAADIGPSATTATRDAAAAASEQAAEQYCHAHPDECAQYNFAITNPTTAAVLGTGTGAQAVGTGLSLAGQGIKAFISSPVVVIATIGVVAFLISRKRTA